MFFEKLFEKKSNKQKRSHILCGRMSPDVCTNTCCSMNSFIEVELCQPPVWAASVDGVTPGGVCLDNRLGWRDLAPTGS